MAHGQSAQVHEFSQIIEQKGQSKYKQRKKSYLCKVAGFHISCA